MGDMVGNNLIRKSNYPRLEKTLVQKVPKIELMEGSKVCNIIRLLFASVFLSM